MAARYGCPAESIRAFRETAESETLSAPRTPLAPGNLDSPIMLSRSLSVDARCVGARLQPATSSTTSVSRESARTLATSDFVGVHQSNFNADRNCGGREPRHCRFLPAQLLIPDSHAPLASP